jgi:hypothetical protein
MPQGDAMRPLRNWFDKDDNTGVLAQTANSTWAILWLHSRCRICSPCNWKDGYTHDAEFARHAIGRRLLGCSEVGVTLTGEFVTQIVPFEAQEYHGIPLFPVIQVAQTQN